MTPRQFMHSQIASAPLKKRERALALWLLDAADPEGYVLSSTRDLYLHLSGTEPEPSGFVLLHSDIVLKALAALHRAGILAFTWGWPLQSDVAIAFVEYRVPSGRVGLHTWDG